MSMLLQVVDYEQQTRLDEQDTKIVSR